MTGKAFPNNLLKHLEVEEQLRNSCETFMVLCCKKDKFCYLNVLLPKKQTKTKPKNENMHGLNF